MTVLGPIPAAELGITLMHEHLIVDVTSWWHPVADAALVDAPVSAAIYGERRRVPFGNRDNCRLDDPQAAAEEVQIFRDLGGRTVADVTSRGIGRTRTLCGPSRARLASTLSWARDSTWRRRTPRKYTACPPTRSLSSSKATTSTVWTESGRGSSARLASAPPSPLRSRRCCEERPGLSGQLVCR